MTKIHFKNSSFKQVYNPNNYNKFSQAQPNSYIVQNPPAKYPSAASGNSQNFSNEKLIGLGLAAVGVALIGYTVFKGRKGITTRQVETVGSQIQQFSRDIEYRKALLRDMGLNPDDHELIKPIVGEEELKELLSKLNPENYSIGKDFNNVKNNIYRANLHVHTSYSDGFASVEQLLDQATKYADEVFSKTGEKFILAITDHDCLESCKEAVRIIAQNPEKYKNLKFTTGIELSSKYENPELFSDPVQLETLVYCINPFDKKINEFISTKIKSNYEYAKKLIDKINGWDGSPDLNLEKAKKRYRHIGYGGSPGFIDDLMKYAKRKLVKKGLFDKNESKYNEVFSGHFEGQKYKSLTDAASSIQEVVKVLEDSGFGIAGVAHPCYIDLKSLRTDKIIEENGRDKYKQGFFLMLEHFKELGIRAAEAHYDYKFISPSWTENARNCINSLGLLNTGGLDTHSNSIFTKKSFLSEKEICNLLKIDCIKEKVNEFLKDIEYRKALLRDMGLNPDDHELIKSIVGEQELKTIIEDLSNNEINFMPGMKTVYANKDPEFDNRYVKSGQYRANLHIHTTNSDGLMTVAELLNQAASYADRVFERTGKEFVLAITDHNTFSGCVEAINIIKNTPSKFKHLKLALGIENGVLFNDKSPNVHVISYCINPADEGLLSLYKPQLDFIINSAKGVINNANNMFADVLRENNFRYSFEECLKIRPSMDKAPTDVRYSMKDYLQFRLIFANAVEQNQNLKSFLEANGIKLTDLDFAEPNKFIFLMPNRDYGKYKHYEYYYQAMKEYVLQTAKEKNSNINEEELKSKFIPVNDRALNVLKQIEEKFLNESSGLCVTNFKQNSFDKTLGTLASQEYGLIGIGHPCMVYPTNYFKSLTDRKNVMGQIFNRFKEIGKDKAVFSEGLYQSYWTEVSTDIETVINDLISKHNLLKTGGLDTHSNNIFTGHIDYTEKELNELIASL